MAVFLKNNCRFPGCGRTFPKLSNLIQHIEEKHIASNPKALERQEMEQPSYINLSYILKIFTKETEKGDDFFGITQPESPDFELRDMIDDVENCYQEENKSVYHDNGDYDINEANDDDSKDDIVGYVQTILHCEKCGKRFKTLKGLHNHRNKQHRNYEICIKTVKSDIEISGVKMKQVKTRLPARQLCNYGLELTSNNSGSVCVTDINIRHTVKQNKAIFSAIKPSAFTVPSTFLYHL